MHGTPFPATPQDVAALTVAEFTDRLLVSRPISIDVVCQRFVGDANRAVVWLIRHQALHVWSERTEIVRWLSAEPARVPRAHELAAAFDLNDVWEFDARRFQAAVQRLDTLR